MLGTQACKSENNMNTVKLTAAQALVKFLTAQYIEDEDGAQPIFAGVFAIFGHGNVAGLGEALYEAREQLPTYRAHNEQGMAHAAIAFAKANRRRRMMACTTSIGPGATNMVTAAALAHVNRLPLLLLPGDIFANRTPDPVLQQVEDFNSPLVSANDCFIPVSRYFDRISRPEQLINSLPVAMQFLLDPVNCGPVTLALPQDVQAQAFDFPQSLFTQKIHRIRRPLPDSRDAGDALELIRAAKKPLIVAGGGVHYSGAIEELANFASKHQIPIAETQAGKGALSWQHECAVGGIGVTGTEAANTLAKEADLVIGVGCRLQDFTTASRTLLGAKGQLLQINIGGFDAHKHGATPLIGDAKTILNILEESLDGWCSESTWLAHAQTLHEAWQRKYDSVTEAPIDNSQLPSDAQVLGAVKRQSRHSDVVVCAAGGLPGELHKLWRADGPGSYHVEYGFSCMGYEIAGGLGVKMADPQREVIVVVGDGSYMMMNSELATSVMLQQKVIVILLDNRGFGCINRLQQATGNSPFNNLLKDCNGATSESLVDIQFAEHAKSMGASGERVGCIKELESAIQRARASTKSYLIEIKTDPAISTDNGDSWWDVAVPETSENPSVRRTFDEYRTAKRKQPY